MHVLVVEDDAEVREFLVRVIREAAWAADAAVNGVDALRDLSAGTYDLVVLDLGLPDVDGFEVCRVLRARGDRTPVLMLTARNAVNDRVRGLDLLLERTREADMRDPRRNFKIILDTHRAAPKALNPRS